MVVEAADRRPLIFDLGTGLRPYSVALGRTLFRGACLLTHLHWDHIQGLPFFSSVLEHGAELDVYAPSQPDGRTAGEVMTEIIAPPAFPVTLDGFPGDIRFHALAEGDADVRGYRVRARAVPHLGVTFGYRVEIHGRVVTYISDHQQPMDGSFGVADAVLDLASGADLLIHDAQFTPEEFVGRPHWGHATADYALHVAAMAGARTLALFHHDPGHADEMLDAQHERFVDAGEKVGVQVITAREGLRVVVG